MLSLGIIRGGGRVGWLRGSGFGFLASRFGGVCSRFGGIRVVLGGKGGESVSILVGWGGRISSRMV